MTTRDAIRPNLVAALPVRWEIASGLVPYEEALARMDREVDAIANGEIDDAQIGVMMI